MTISGVVTRFIAEEHSYRPLPKTVHLLGKQSILVGLDTIYSIMRAANIVPKDVEITYEDLTRQAGAKGQPSIADTSFFELFGVETVRAIDHSDFEGADIVFDLTRELPNEHVGSVDFLFDGSVMDNIFDPASAMENVARLLRPGGRYVGVNAGSTRWLPAYVAFNPYWFFDFFVANGFRDVKVYLMDFSEYRFNATWLEGEVYLLDASADHRNVHNYPISPGAIAMLIIAEKGEDSTWNERTSQAVYRLPEEWEVFDRNLERVKQSRRPVVPLVKRANNRGGSTGFTYVGSIDGNGGFSYDPALTLPTGDVFIDMGKAFHGHGWGPLGSFDGVGWRWVEGSSVVLVNPPRGRRCSINAKIHTAATMESIASLRVSVEGAQLASTIKTEGGTHNLVADVKFAPGDRPLELAFQGGGVALSEIRVTATGR